MNVPRVFTVAEVDALIPTLSRMVEQQLLEQSEIERGFAELARLQGDVPQSLEPCDEDPPPSQRVKAELKERMLRYDAGWKRIQELGAVIKDPQIGLIDFYGHVNNQLVWLCWRYGEDSLKYYHALDAGYSGRRLLDRDLRQSLLN